MMTTQANTLFLAAVYLPPPALAALGPLRAVRDVETPFGAVEQVGLRVSPDGVGVYILPYSGSPTRSDPRATVWAAKALGVQRILLFEPVIALEKLALGGLVLPVDFFDFTRHLPVTFRRDQDVGWLQERPVFCPETMQALREAFPTAKTVSVYAGLDGPRRETAAEARLYRAWGARVLGFNAIPEVLLARELELCFGVIGVVNALAGRLYTPLSGEAVSAAIQEVTQKLPAVIGALAGEPHCGCNLSQAEARARGLLSADWRTWVTEQ